MTMDLLGSILAATPRCMYCSEPATVDDDPFKLCDRCESRLVAELKQPRFSVTSDPMSDVNVAAGAIRAPASAPAVTNNSDPVPSSRASRTGVASAASPLSFEDEVAALEVEWLRVGIIMNSMTLSVMQDNPISAKSDSA